MLIPASAIRDWRDLQDKVADLFREMGYEVRSPHVVDMVRGRKEIDVYVVDPRTSVPQVILIECKHWAGPVHQETVHSMRTVVQDTGANSGIIVSSGGFQSGAGEAAANSNIDLKTWEALQVAYGNEWYLRQMEVLAPLLQELRGMDRDYLDQSRTPAPATNRMRFVALGRFYDLMDLLEEGRMIVFGCMPGAQSYDQPGPIKIQVDETYPGAKQDRHGLWILELPDVRAWFRWAVASARSVIERYKALKTEVFDAFEDLDDAAADRAFERLFDEIAEDTPVHALRGRIGDEEYQRLLSLLRRRGA